MYMRAATFAKVAMIKLEKIYDIGKYNQVERKKLKSVPEDFKTHRMLEVLK